MNPDGEFKGRQQFATTQWSVVRAVGRENSSAAASALQSLCQSYWYPLYTYVRRQGHDAETAADLTQSFFADLLQRQDLKKVDPSLGKFRSFLLTALKHFLLNEWDRAGAQKRGGRRSPLSLDFGEADQRYQMEPAHATTAELIYLKQWAKTLIDRVYVKLRLEFEKRGKAHRFDKLRDFLAGQNDEQTMASVAKQLSMSEVAVKVAVHRMRQRFGQILREEIEETVADAADVDAEIQQLFDVLRN